MTSSQLWLIIGMAVVTYLPRVLPVLMLSNREISAPLKKWMSFIPVAIFSALVFSDIFFWNDTFNAHPFDNAKLIPSIIVFYLAYKTKNMLLSMMMGVLAIALMLYVV
ncbi:AzlD domain-containing protein [Atopococcus tabaci]|uniref:AzlD domain-containing protein n=1 Tax=Atopococcus tabaci TaxID=269774 RepID=UPI002409FB7D|nr:AzlD domain-containing protein [Atopococcus tabaci]